MKRKGKEKIEREEQGDENHITENKTKQISKIIIKITISLNVIGP